MSFLAVIVSSLLLHRCTAAANGALIRQKKKEKVLLTSRATRHHTLNRGKMMRRLQPAGATKIKTTKLQRLTAHHPTEDTTLRTEM